MSTCASLLFLVFDSSPRHLFPGLAPSIFRGCCSRVVTEVSIRAKRYALRNPHQAKPLNATMRRSIVSLAIGMARATSRRGVFCCKTEMNYTRFGDPDCGRHDLVYVGERRPTGRPRWTQALSVEFAISVLSNAAFVAPIWMLARRGRVCDVITATALAASSTAYHACEIAQIEFMRMNAGNWHRLDNVFSILSFASLVPLLMGRANSVAPTQEQLDLCRWTVLVVGLVFQELNPWHIACM